MTSKVLRHTASDIRRYGRTIIVVPDSDPGPFLYTIGNWTRRLPDLLVFGKPEPIMGAVLNLVSDLQRDRGKAFEHGEIVSIDNVRLPVKFIDATALRVKDEYTVQAGQHYGHEDYQVRQMLIPDKQGRFPDDPLCAQPYASQPIHWIE